MQVPGSYGNTNQQLYTKVKVNKPVVFMREPGGCASAPSPSAAPAALLFDPLSPPRRK
jgi:hypothetical protein